MRGEIHVVNTLWYGIWFQWSKERWYYTNEEEFWGDLIVTIFIMKNCKHIKGAGPRSTQDTRGFSFPE